MGSRGVRGPIRALVGGLVLVLAGCAGAPPRPVPESSLHETEMWPNLRESLRGMAASCQGIIRGKESERTYFRPTVRFGDPPGEEPVAVTELPEGEAEFAIDFGNPELGDYRRGTGVLEVATTLRWHELPPGVESLEGLEVTGSLAVEGTLDIQEGWVSPTRGSAPIDEVVRFGDPSGDEAGELAYRGEETVVYRPENQSFGGGKVYLSMRARVTLVVEVRAPR